MTRATLLLLLGAALLLGACGGGGGGGGNWQTFDASEGGFRVSMPGKPTKGRDVLTTTAGPLEGVNYVYTTPDQRVAYGLEGQPGRAVELALGDGRFVRARLSLVGQRQYQLVVVTPDERTAANDAERFLESFRLLR